MNWDLSALFNSIPEAEEFLKQAIFKAKEFEKKYKNRLYTLNPQEFIEVLKEYEEMHENKRSIEKNIHSAKKEFILVDVNTSPESRGERHYTFVE